jgi:hypothetical protein
MGKTHKNRLTQQQFETKANLIHGGSYDYSKSVYNGYTENVIIICPMHGQFEQKPHTHLRGNGCPCCRRHKLRTAFASSKEDFVEKAKIAHENSYDYSSVEYVNNVTKVCIICKKHGEFWQSPSSHINMKCGCPKCKKKEESKLELLLLHYFSDWQLSSQEKMFSEFHGGIRHFDFVLRSEGRVVIVEYDGEQHFGPVRFHGMSAEKADQMLKRQKRVDFLDHVFCEKNGFVLHRVKHSDDKTESLVQLNEKIKVPYGDRA